MHQIDRRKIENNLLLKGFIRDDSHHRYFHHEYNGKRTGIYTFTSHGSEYKTYGLSLLKKMKIQLKLDRIQDVCDLFNCPLSGEDYNQKLIDKGILD